jgi:N6-adenosine-specific RNA methylase IME4
MEKYNTLYLDPPMEKMSWGDLEKLPVASWCQANAMLFMWVRTRRLEYAMSVFRNWGFYFVYMIERMPLRKFQEANVWDAFVCEHLVVAARGKVKLNAFHRENLFESEPENKGYHPQFMRDRVVEVADWVFDYAKLLDVFGKYWFANDPDYWRDEWDFLDGVTV